MDGDDYKLASSLLSTTANQPDGNGATSGEGSNPSQAIGSGWDNNNNSKGGGLPQRRGRSANQFLYDENGRRLRGAAAAAAALLNDHSRYATTPEDREFVREQRWREAAAAAAAGGNEEVGSAPLASSSTTALRRYQFGGGDSRPLRPDMFGNSSGGNALGRNRNSNNNSSGGGGLHNNSNSNSNSVLGSALALERVVKAWGEDEDEDGERRKRRRVFGAVTPLHQWAYMRSVTQPTQGGEGKPEDGRQEASGIRRPEVFQPQGRWRRADEVLETEALLLQQQQQQRSPNPETDLKPYTDALNAYNLISLCASGDQVTGSGAAQSNSNSTPSAGSAVVGLGGVVAPDGAAHDAFSFFTFTEAEYDALPSLAQCQEQSLPENNCAGFRFDYRASRKLFTLYERYGSFIVVADRWTPPSPTASVATATEISPSVEDLCGEYQRVTRGVMLLRVRRLQQTLLPFYLEDNEGGPGGKAGKPEKSPGKSNREPRVVKSEGKSEKENGEYDKVGEEDDESSNNKNNRPAASATASALQKVNQHPLLTLMAKHPYLADCEEYIFSLPPQRKDEDVAIVKRGEDQDEQQQQQQQHERLSSVQLFKNLTSPAVHSEDGSPRRGGGDSGGLGRPWYDVEGERRRRRGLVQLLQKESEVNVSYQRAAATYLSLVPRAGHALKRLQNLVQLHPLGDPGKGEPAFAPFSSDSLFHLFDDPAIFDIQLRALPEVDPAAWQAAEAALQSQAPLPVNAPLEGAVEKPKGGKTTAALTAAAVAAASAESTTLGSTIFEAFHQLPVTCARLLLAAQAGWLLPPPEPLTQKRGSSSATSRGGKSNTTGKRQRSETDSDTEEDDEGEERRSRKRERGNNGKDHSDSDTERPSMASASVSAVASAAAAGHASGLSRQDARQLLSEVIAAGVCNRCHSMLSESVLLTLPHLVPRLHKEVEEDLEKYLWDDAAALMDNSPSVVAHWVPVIRLAYTQNILLKRLHLKLENLLESMQKVKAATAEALADMESRG